MTLEEYIAHLNSLAFWREFTFAQNKFSPKPGKELELADNLVWFGDRAYILQLKERHGATGDPESERNWFKRKVMGKATSQIRDSLRYLDEHSEIRITNQHGHTFDIASKNLTTIIKIVIFLPAPELPDECWRTRYHLSQSSDAFIHILAVNDYLGILEKLRVPEDIARYFEYRQELAPRLTETGSLVEEADIMGAFLNEEEIPTPKSRDSLRQLVQDFDAFDLSGILADLHKHIELTEKPYEYYDILREFARVPRSVWREIKLRIMKSLEVTGEKRFAQPFRLSFPESNCAFMIAPLDPELPATGREGKKIRSTGVANFTAGAKYLAKTSKCVGLLISREGEYVQLDWCLVQYHWQPDPELDAWLLEANPFRAVSEKWVDGFLFAATPPVG